MPRSMPIRQRRREFAWTAAIIVAIAAGGVGLLLINHRPPPLAAATPTPDVSMTPGPTSQTASPSARTTPHVMVIIEENRGYASTLGSCGADPYLCSLASGYASLTSWYGIAHPSAPNYVAMDAGSTHGITSDCTPDGGGCGPFSAPDLGGELSSARIPWIAYMESMPSPCDRVGSAGGYAEKHDPFMYFTADRGSACAAHIRPYPGSGPMVAALDSSAPPDFVWITPNLDNDMHDGSVSRGDAWLRANLPEVLSSSWFANHGTVIVTMDENDANPFGSCCGNAFGGRVPMVVISATARGRGAVSTSGDHYSTLRSIEEAFGLALLGNAASASDVHALFG